MKRGLLDWCLTLAVLALSVGVSAAVQAKESERGKATASSGDTLIVDAREALRKKDRARLSAARAQSLAERHPLAQWVEHWDLQNRINEVSQAEMDTFFARWSGTYVEDRMRNDWLLELGRRRDWINFAREFPRFRMNDDREVTCFALLVEHQAGKDVRGAARDAWFAVRDPDDGCTLLATTLVDARAFSPDLVWARVRLAVEQGRQRSARNLVGLIHKTTPAVMPELWDKPERFLARKSADNHAISHDLVVLALSRLASSDPAAAAAQMDERWSKRLAAPLAAWAWSQIGRQAALRLQGDASDQFQQGFTALGKADMTWSDDVLAWQVRAALRATPIRWGQVVQAVGAMSVAEQADPAWRYWRARAVAALAPAGVDGDAVRATARVIFEDMSEQMHFYGNLAASDLGRALTIPPKPAPLLADERVGARANPGLTRALQLIALGLRNEGVREWNYSLRGMDERALLAAAQWACEREVWDRCINTSDRTRREIDLEQRFPTPFRQAVVAQARSIGLDPALVYGLIRQESRFIMDARSHVGASGLMQLMPATARWTAKKVGMNFTPDMINDRDTNLKLGTTYLKLVLDDFDGSMAMAAAAYNAGPSRPRRWREGATLEPAIWAENIPFNETRDYVKKVLSNAMYYSALLNPGPVGAIKSRLGQSIAPRGATAPAVNNELP